MSSPSGTEASTTSSSPNSVVATAGAGGNNAPKYGTLVPNRVFVGGISGSTTEAELTQLFSAYGNVRATKIINDRAGVSKGYGFVTFETEEEARRLQAEADCIVLKERKLNIAPAIKKQAPTYPQQTYNRGYETTPTVPSGTVFFHNGYPYTYQNGMAFFATTAANGSQDVATAAAANGYVAASPYPQPQPPPSYPATTVMFQQPMYIPQQYQYQALPPSSPIPSPYLYASQYANGSGGGGTGGSAPSSMPPSSAPGTTHHHHHTAPPPSPFYSAAALPTQAQSLALPPHHHQPAAQVPEMYMTGPTTAIYAAQPTAYPMPVPEIYETPPMTELSSTQSTEAPSALVYTPMASGMGRQQQASQQQQPRRYASGPRRQGGGGRHSGGGGDAGTPRPVHVLPSSAVQQQQRVARVNKCNKSVKRQEARDGSGDAPPCVPLTPPGTPSPGSAVERTAVSSDPVCQMQALSLQ